MSLAGLLYSSWPLGYWLNPVADKRLASDLEALHQPFNWVFIAMDIVSGIFIGIACWQLAQLAEQIFDYWIRLGLLIAIYGTATFGFLTFVDAMLPLDCLEGSRHCISPLHNPYFVIHGIFSIGSVGGLTVSIVMIWLLLILLKYDNRTWVHLVPATFLVVWVAFGLLTIFLFLHNQSSAFAQHLFIGFCSLWLIALPYFTRLMLQVANKTVEPDVPYMSLFGLDEPPKDNP